MNKIEEIISTEEMLKEMKKKFIKRFTRMHTYLDGNALVMDGSPDAVWEFFEPHIYSVVERFTKGVENE